MEYLDVDASLQISHLALAMGGIQTDDERTQAFAKAHIRFMLEVCFDILGTDRLLYASDYPHWDFDSPSIITNLPFLSDDDRKRILADNVAEVFDL